MRGSGGRTASRLLVETLRPEAGGFAAVTAVLVVAMGLRLWLPTLLGHFVDDAIAGHPASALVRAALLYMVVALSAVLLQLGVTWGSVWLSWRSGNRLRERLARHATRLEMAWHGRFSPGQLIERIDGDVEAIVVFSTSVVVNILGNIALTAGMLVVSFRIDPVAGGLLSLAAFGGGTLLFRLRTLAVPAREREREANAILYGDLEERLGGLEDLKANGAGPYAVHRLHQNSARSWRRARRASLIGDSANSAAASTFAASSAGMLALGFFLVRRDMATVGEVVALYRYSEMLRQPLEAIAEQMKEFQKALAGARRATAMLATQPAVVDGPRGLEAFGASSHAALSVTLDEVTFGYHDDAPPALRGVTLEVPAGARLGIVGRTGSGKTTLSRLVLRLWDVDDGSVRLGGIDVRDLELHALRDRIAVVTQDVEIFRATVRENLTLFGRRPATDAELLDVICAVGLDEWFEVQGAGLDTELDGAGSLSAGEAQLLAFGRAMLTDPSVVVLDEASSRLDPASEQRISVAMERLLADRTALIVAHRLETLETVDLIAVVDDGELVEFGDRAQLADSPSRYADLRRLAATGVTMEELG